MIDLLIGQTWLSPSSGNLYRIIEIDGVHILIQRIGFVKDGQELTIPPQTHCFHVVSFATMRCISHDAVKYDAYLATCPSAYAAR